MCSVPWNLGRDGILRFPRRSGVEFAKVIAGIARRYPLARTIHLVVDNLNIHCRKSLTNHLGPELGA
jgi:hypothetical protein